MIVPPLALLPFLGALMLGAAAPALGRCLPPRAAVRLLTGGAVVAALSCGFVLAVLAFDGLAQLPPLARAGNWSPTAVSSTVPLRPAAGLTVALLVLTLLAAAVRQLASVARELAAAQTRCRRLGPGAASLVIVRGARPDAYTLPGWPGRIVVSTSMLAALPPRERRVLIAHEGSHLRHHHHVYLALTRLGAAANPLLHPVTTAVSLAVERWADEDAARDIGDRRTTAQALARAALTRSAGVAAPVSPDGPALSALSASPFASAPPPGAVANGGAAPRGSRSQTSQRVGALLLPEPPPRLVLRTALLVLIAATAASALGLARTTEVQFEHARTDLTATAGAVATR